MSNKTSRKRRCAAAAMVVSSIGIASHVCGQVTASWLNAVSGSWTDPTMWSTNPVYPHNGTPVGQTYDVVIAAAGAPYTVTFQDLGFGTEINNLTLGSSSATLDLYQGLVLFGNADTGPGTLRLSKNGLRFAGGASSLAGNIVLSAATTQSSFDEVAIYAGGGTLTITPGTTIHADHGRSSIALSGSSTCLSFATISLEAEDSEFILGANVRNLGLITMSDGTLNLRGAVSLANLGAVQRAGGEVKLTGTIQNANSTFSLGAFGGSLILGNDFVSSDGGRINGGTITAVPGAQLICERGSISGVSLDTDVTAKGSLHLDGVVNLAAGRQISLVGGNSAANLIADGSALLGGSGEIVFNGGSFSDGCYGSGTLVIGAGLTVRTGSGSGRLGEEFPVSQGTLINRGTVAVQTPGQSISFRGKWSNEGTISLSQGDLNLGGSFHLSDIGTLLRSGGNLNVSGTLDLGGSPLVLNDETGSWNFKGRVKNGTISTSGSAMLLSRGGTFDAVSLVTDFIVQGGINTTILTNGSAFSGHEARLVAEPIPVGGAGLGTDGATFGLGVRLVLDAGQNNWISATSPAFVLDSLSSVRTGTGGGSLSGSSKGNATSFGTISAQTAGCTINVASFDNHGVMQAVNGATLSLTNVNNFASMAVANASLLVNTPLLNFGSISVTNGSLSLAGVSECGAVTVTDSMVFLGGSFSPADVAPIQHVGDVSTYITGILRLNGGVFAPSAATGTWTLLGGWVADGTIATGTNGAAIVLPANGSASFGDVTLDTDFVVPSGASLNSANSLTLHEHLLTLQDRAELYYVDRYWNIRGDGTIRFDGQGSAIGPGSALYGSGSLTLYSGVTIETGTSDGLIGAPSLSITNMATVSAKTPGKSISIVGTFDNRGTLESRNGGKIVFTSPSFITNLSNGSLTAGTWAAYAGSTIDFGAASVLTSRAAVILDGLGSSFPSLEGFTNNSGSFTVSGGRVFNTADGFTNAGTFTAATGAIATFGASSTNSGTIIANGGSIDCDSLTNYSSRILTGGTYRAMANSQIIFAGPIFTNAATIRLEATSASIPAADSINENDGSFLLSSRSFTSAGPLTNNGTITIQNGSSFIVTGHLTTRRFMTATFGANLIRCSSGLTNEPGTAANAGRVSIGSLSTLVVDGSLINSGTVILDGSAVLNYDGPSPLAAIAAQISSGYNAGAWNGPGINSSLARFDKSRRIGYAEASDLGLSTFAGQPVDSTAVLMRLTFGGDSNLDGAVDAADLGALATNWQSTAVWIGGDFNYDGFVDVTDLGLLATNWQAGVGSAPGAASFQQALASVGLGNIRVPEPVSLGLIAFGMIGLSARVRRRLIFSRLNERARV